MVLNSHPKNTYELNFYDLSGNLDSIQQYRTEEDARAAMKMFDEENSAEIYSRIILIKTEWDKRVRQYWLDTLDIFDSYYNDDL